MCVKAMLGGRIGVLGVILGGGVFGKRCGLWLHKTAGGGLVEVFGLSQMVLGQSGVLGGLAGGCGEMLLSWRERKSDVFAACRDFDECWHVSANQESTESSTALGDILALQLIFSFTRKS